MMNFPEDSSADPTFGQKILWGLNHGAFKSPLGKRLVRAWALGVSDPVIRQLVEDELRPLSKQQALGQLPPFKAPHLNEGDFVLGKDIHGAPIRLHKDWLSSGMLLVSNTGGGKTNLLCFWALQLGVAGCPIWLSESYKTQLRRLRQILRRAGVELVILGGRDWRWNLLQCHFGNPQAQLNHAVDLLVRVLDLPPRSRIILAQGLHALYERFGIWTGNSDTWPCLFDVYEWARATAGLNPQARDAILDRLGSLLLALTPKCAAYRAAWNPADLVRHSIVFEMRGMAETAKQILLQSLLFSVFQGEVERGVVNGPLKLVIAFDDSQRFFDAGAQSNSGELTPMDELAGIIRGTGISLWVLAQTAAGLSRRLVPNLGIKIIGRLGSHEDYAGLGADLGLSSDQIDYGRLKLGPGSFIGQVAHEWREPFAFNVPLLHIQDSADDREAAESRRALDSLPTVFADDFAQWRPNNAIDVSENTTPSPAQRAPVLDEAAIRFIKVVLHNPGRPSSAYTRLAGLGAQQAIEIRERLVAAGFLREHRVATGARGRQAIVLEPMPAAYEAVANAGDTL